MPHPTALAHRLPQPSARAGLPARRGVPRLAATLLAFGAMACAQAQLVPRAVHAFHQSATGDLSETRISWHPALRAAATDAPPAGKGLSATGRGFWPQWEGRIGIVIDRPLNPLKDSFVLMQPMATGLKLRSLHVLSDYYLDGGFRATAGLVRGETAQAWWSGGDHGGGLNLSLQRIDSLGMVANRVQTPSEQRQTRPYVGAGYSSRLSDSGQASAWRFNADVGLVTEEAGRMSQLSQVIQGNMALDQLVRELRLRPVVKVSLGYAF